MLYNKLFNYTLFLLIVNTTFAITEKLASHIKHQIWTGLIL